MMATERRTQNLRGPHRALDLSEQVEVRRRMREQLALGGGRDRLARRLALQYGVSARTIWRYAERLPVPPSMAVMAKKVWRWAARHDLQLSYDAHQELLFLVLRHREEHPAINLPTPRAADRDSSAARQLRAPDQSAWSLRREAGPQLGSGSAPY